MNFNLGKTISKKDVNFFIILSFFLIYLGFILSKGFVKNEEISDIIFLSLCVLLTETVYLLISNQKIHFNIRYKKDYLILITFLILLFLIWNSEVIYNYKNILIFFLTKILLVIPLVILINFNKVDEAINNKIDFYLQILILSILLTGLFYQTSYASLNFFLTIIILSTIVLLISLICSTFHKWIDFFLAVIIFILLSKIFLLSSEKDAFHYSWFIGPINSISENYKLLDNVSSQYGYLNVLIINKLSNLFKINSTYTLCSFIIILFFIYFKIFYNKIASTVKLPITLVTSFLCFLIFGNVGFSNLAGAMFIPSSSVFRFLPSLLTIIIFSEIINKKSKSIFLLFCFLVSFLVSLLWSFESAVFVLFSLSSFYVFKFIINLFNKERFNNIYSVKIKDFKIEVVLLFSLIIVFFLFYYTNTFSLFYEHALNTEGSLSKEIKNNKITLIFIYLLILCYLILRDSFENKSIFCFNVLWFSLFIAYSGYYLIRSVDNNIFNILPFILFIICSMKTNSIQIRNLKFNSIYTIIFFTIISSLFSLTLNKDKFYNNLTSKNLLNTPKFLNENYLPNEEILNSINKFPDIPLTLITGKTTHIKNLNLPQFGYGLPILPLEHFNILNDNTKQYLINDYFNINQKHLLLCINECKFYNSNKDSNTYSKIFLGNNIKYEKLIEVKTNKLSEVLYVLSTK